MSAVRCFDCGQIDYDFHRCQMQLDDKERFDLLCDEVTELQNQVETLYSQVRSLQMGAPRGISQLNQTQKTG